MPQLPNLINVPTFTFRQGDENPIQVTYYNGTIVLTQEGDFSEDERICLNPRKVRALLNAILKHQPEAEHWLNREKK